MASSADCGFTVTGCNDYILNLTERAVRYPSTHCSHHVTRARIHKLTCVFMQLLHTMLAVGVFSRDEEAVGWWFAVHTILPDSESATIKPTL